MHAIFVLGLIWVHYYMDKSKSEASSIQQNQNKDEFARINGNIIVRELKLNENYSISWIANVDKGIIEFNTTVKTKGFIGFGLSYTGGMKDADIVIGGVYPNGTTYFSDRHGTGEVEPVVDTIQDWALTSANENKTHTTLTFHRKLDTCDELEDIKINDDSLRIIWSYGSTDDIRYHGVNRGTQAEFFLAQETQNPDLSGYKTWTLAQKVDLPAVDTTYWCTFYQTPKLEKKHHVVGYDIFLNNTVSQRHTHHAALYRCTTPPGEDATNFFSKYLGYGFDCYYSPDYFPVEYCQLFEFQWSIGGKITILPQNIGLPIGEEEVEFFMTEIHYDNPESLGGMQAHTGMRFYYTDKLREIEAGFLQVGSVTAQQYALTIPPNSEDFVVSHHCVPECTTQFPEGGMNVFIYLLHSHLAGRTIRVRQFRNGTELPWFAHDEHYNSAYQHNREFRNIAKIYRGDHLTLECKYENKWKEGKSTTGGRSPIEEMCKTFFLYYPRMPTVNKCGSYFPQQEMLRYMGIQNVTQEKRGADPIVTSPQHLAGKRYHEVVDEINWDAAKRQEFQKLTRYGLQQGYCSPYDKNTLLGSFPLVQYPKYDKPYVPPSSCVKMGPLSLPLTQRNFACRPRNNWLTSIFIGCFTVLIRII